MLRQDVSGVRIWHLEQSTRSFVSVAAFKEVGDGRKEEKRWPVRIARRFRKVWKRDFEIGDRVKD